MVVPEEFIWHTRPCLRISRRPRGTVGSSHTSLPLPELRKGVATGVVGIAGCLTLMQWNVRRTNATNPGGNLVLYRTELDHQRSYQPYQDFLQRLPAICVEGRRIWLSRTPLICFEIVELHVPDRVMLQFGLEQVTPPEDVEHVTRISQKGRAGEDWALYHRDYIAGGRRGRSMLLRAAGHAPRRHAPSAYMRWYLGVTRRYIAPPPTELAMVYHPRGYTEEALVRA
ncbi:hypothetical protein H6P81_010510 [Aristolochia fimbriata]|uniref:Aminotransferase-like plant mobile domain-containing protein n=1 Tax=Aristolochia fimbriata TaxID=158543 RepID=A0AAV7ENZ2_ARIFI|nr:hypothetical protein H6P81_010510 [Aristolochia fimbriata]